MGVVVTGSSGFLGAAVVHELTGAGYDVVGIDRRPAPTTRITADLLAGHPAVETALREADGVLHLAARPGVRDRTPGVERLRWRDNVVTTARVLDLLPTRRPVVATSSSSVYGGARGRACHEDDALHPRGGYARSKLAAERLCAARAAAGGAVLVARPFTVVGEGQRPDMALSIWAAQARAGRPLTVFGGLHRTRDVTDVQHVARALVRLLELGGRGLVNIGSGQPRTLAALVAAVGRALGTPVDVDVRPASPEDPVDTRADVTRLRQRLGYWPRTDLDAAVRRAVGLGADVPA